MNDKIIKILKNIALLLEIKGDNPFKSRAYSNAAEIIETQNIDIEKAVRAGSLAEIKGFGKALQEKISDFVHNGRMEYYEKLKEEVPLSLLKIVKLPNIGPKKAGKLFREHGVKTLDDLETMCKSGHLAKLKGFSPKSQEMIFMGIGHIKANIGRFAQEIAKEEAGEILQKLKKIEGAAEASFTGSMRRFTETIRRIELIVSSESDVGESIKKLFNASFKDGRYRFTTESGVPVEIETAGKNSYYWRLHQSTGNDLYRNEFNNYLIKKNITPSDIELRKNGSSLKLGSEEEIYRFAGIQYVEPELREDADIIRLALENKIPPLLEKKDLKGMIHVHSTWSDGKNSLLEMAIASKTLGFEYMVICDHSRSASYAGGLTPEEVKRQHEEIDRFNEENHGITILKGIESDILNDGSLDYDEKTLELFDLVVASVHSSFNMDKKKMTRRIISALRSPYATILGHPTGRLLLSRQPYEVDMQAVIEAAADFGKIIEINSNPYRLDLSWQNARYAKSLGVRIAVNPDSHRTSTLTDVFTGVKAARKGMLSHEDVVNCLSLEDFRKEIIMNQKRG